MVFSRVGHIGQEKERFFAFLQVRSDTFEMKNDRFCTSVCKHGIGDGPIFTSCAEMISLKIRAL